MIVKNHYPEHMSNGSTALAHSQDNTELALGHLKGPSVVSQGFRGVSQAAAIPLHRCFYDFPVILTK